MSGTDGPLSFELLGELRAHLDGRPLDLGPRLQRSLLAILLVEAGRIVAVDRLIDLLWGDSPPAAAVASVQAYISGLRRILEPDRPARAPAQILVTQDPGYAIKVQPERIDGPTFLRLASEGRALLDAGRPQPAADRLDEALGLWRGRALVEFEHEPWAAAAASRLTEARHSALEDRVDAWLALGRHLQVVSDIEELVQEAPLRERRWGQLIVATYRSGRQADALRAYQRCRTVLGEELGIEPGPELRRLESAVLSQDATLDFHRADGETGYPGSSYGSSSGAVSAEAGSGETGSADVGIFAPASAPDLPIVVRAAQLDRFAVRVSRARQGRGGVVVLVGEPGVGKTTLAEQAADSAADVGSAVIWTRCLDPAAAPAYWPWVQVLRGLPPGSVVDEARFRLEGRAEQPSAGKAAAFHAYESLLDALRAESSTKPLLLVIDDLQAADDASLELLLLLAGDLDRLPVLVLATLRDTEPSQALDRTLGELLRHRGSERLAVPPLRPDEVARLIERTTGHSPDPEVAESLFERTGGNFFYMVELLRLLVSEHRDRPLTPEDVTRADVPSDVRDVVLRRAAHLPENTRTLLTVAAVAGRDVDLDLLERATHLDSEQLMLSLEPAVAAGLLTAAESGWGYRFRHPLIQESIDAGTGRVERARLHTRLGVAIETLPDAHGARRLAELSHHYLAAGPLGDPDKAVDYSRRAAAGSMKVGAWGEAIRVLQRALTLLPAGDPAVSGIRCDVLVELGGSLRSAGMVRESHAALEESIELADRIGDQDRILNAAVAFGAVALWGSREWGETDPRLVARLEGQLDRLGPGDDPRRVRILSTLATELGQAAEANRGWDYAQQAMSLARRLEDPESLGIALTSYVLSALGNDFVEVRLPVIEEFLARPELGLGPDVHGILRTNLLTERLRYGELALFDSELPRAWELATEVLHSVELQAQLYLFEACRALITGDSAGALSAAERGLGLMISVSGTWAEPAQFLGLTGLHLVTHTLADHAEELEEQASNPVHRSIPHLAAPAAALAYVERHDRGRALEITGKWFAPPPMTWSWMQAIAYWAQVAAAIGEPDPGWLYDQLLGHSGELAVVGIGVDCGGAVDCLLGALALRLGRRDEALERAQAGLALERQAGSRQWLARTTGLIEAARS
jgi:DNA-binding SARP family transcriptional activator